MSELSFEYAKALYELSSSQDDKEVILHNLKEFAKVLENRDIMRFFTHPEINIDKKKELIKKDVPEGVLRDFFYVLLDNKRIQIVDEIASDYEQIFLTDSKTKKAVVYSNKPLTEDYLNKLEKQLESRIGASVILTNLIDEKITAGIRIEYESTVIDLTVDKKLSNLITNLKE